MTWGDGFQIFGALIEIGGIVVVARGIAETRRQFPGQGPGTLIRVLRRLRARLPWTKPAPPNLEAESASSVEEAFEAILSADFHWAEDLGERVERIQTIVQQHEDAIAKVHSEIKAERRAWEFRISQVNEEIEGLKGHTERRIAETATSGLDREVVGVLLFTIGLGLQTYGNVVLS